MRRSPRRKTKEKGKIRTVRVRVAKVPVLRCKKGGTEISPKEVKTEKRFSLTCSFSIFVRKKAGMKQHDEQVSRKVSLTHRSISPPPKKTHTPLVLV